MHFCNSFLEQYSVSTYREETPVELVNHYFESKGKKRPKL